MSKTILDEFLFAPEEFDEMMFNPLKKRVLKDFVDDKVLNKIGNWKNIKIPESLKKDRVIAYICLYYDMFSPSDQIKDYVKRKIWCAAMAGFEYDEYGLFSDEVDDMLRNKNKEVNMMIIDYLIAFNDIDYSAIRVGTESYNNKLYQITNMDNQDAKKSDVELEKIRGDLWKQAVAMQSELHQMTERFLKDDNKLLKRDLFCVINKSVKSLNINPESRAKRATDIFAI